MIQVNDDGGDDDDNDYDNDKSKKYLIYDFIVYKG